MKEVANFATLPQSYASMMYIVMFSNWPMFMDAAGVVGNLVVAKVFFYSFKAIGFYFVMPVRLGALNPSVANLQPHALVVVAMVAVDVAAAVLVLCGCRSNAPWQNARPAPIYWQPCSRFSITTFSVETMSRG